MGYTMGGVQSFDYRGSRQDSLAGDVIVLHPDETHDGRAGAESGFRYRMLYIEPRLIRDALTNAANTLPFVPAAVSSDVRLGRALRSALEDLDRPLEPLEADQTILNIAEAMLALDPTAARRSSATVCSVAVERARQYLGEHAGRAVTSEELEALTGLDRYSLARQFRVRLGTSPYRYLSMRRLDRAKSLMRDNYSLAEAAVESGFVDQSHMTRQFKRAYGLSPGRWRALSFPALSA
jgi:AraC-like DNA-binding protein